VTLVGISESPDGTFAPLPSVIKEIKVIKESTPRNIIIANNEAITSKVVAELPSSEWLHLACHGQQGNPKEPLKSCLLLYDGKLYLKQLLSMPLQNAEFVFLSACETAMGDTTMSNEALHLAGGMLFAGFKSAIATLWSINDDDGPTIAKVVYEHLFAPEGQRTAADSAEALQKAVNYLRSMGVPAHRWVPFIHIGV
jgi:CHAT domain-containing protein